MPTSQQYASAVDCLYLRRWHHINYRMDGVMVGVYATTRALGRLMFMERRYDPNEWGPKQVALRQLPILENVKYLPLIWPPAPGLVFGHALTLVPLLHRRSLSASMAYPLCTIKMVLDAATSSDPCF
nr:RNA-dependent RNA polymerase [Picobirnavirus sp.]